MSTEQSCQTAGRVLTGFKNFAIEDKGLIESYTRTWELDCSDLSFANLFI